MRAPSNDRRSGHAAHDQLPAYAIKVWDKDNVLVAHKDWGRLISASPGKHGDYKVALVSLNRDIFRMPSRKNPNGRGVERIPGQIEYWSRTEMGQREQKICAQKIIFKLDCLEDMRGVPMLLSPAMLERRGAFLPSAWPASMRFDETTTRTISA